LTPFLKGIGYGPNTVRFVPVSGQTGVNVMQKVDAAVCPWYDGKSLIETLDSLDPIPRDNKGPLRIPIIDKFKDRGVFSIFGKIEQGTVQLGSKVILMPNKQETEVVGMKFYDDDIDFAKAGDNVQLMLKGVDEGDVQAGHVVCDTVNPPIPVVKEFLAQFMVLDKPLFAAGYSAIMHIHAASELVTIGDFVAKVDRKTGKKLPGKPKVGKTGETLIAKMELDKPLCMEKFETNQHLGRFTVRETSGTVMVGKVIGIKPL
jgi:peptide chain release factor subunit 3